MVTFMVQEVGGVDCYMREVKTWSSQIPIHFKDLCLFWSNYGWRIIQNYKEEWRLHRTDQPCGQREYRDWDPEYGLLALGLRMRRWF